MSLWSRLSSDDIQKDLLGSMESTLKVAKDTRSNSYTQSLLLDRISTSVREVSLNVQDINQSMTGQVKRISFDFTRSLSAIKSLNDGMGDLLKGMTEEARERRESDERNRRDSDDNNFKLADGINSVSRTLVKISGYLEKIANMTKEYHEYTSNLLRYTGSGLESVSDYRNELTHNIVSELNKDIGKEFFNSTESYKLLTDTALNANIGSLDALEEISRPVLLAESALQTDVTKIAELFNKFYLRYNFSSRSMESMVNNILTYTSDNQAQAASVAEGLYELSDEIAIYARGDEDKINTYTDTLAKSLSWVESLGQNSATYTSDLNKIFSGAHYTDQGLRQILEMGGLNTVEAQKLAKSGDFDTLIEALFTGRANWGKQIIDNPRFADVLPVYGLSEDELENAYGAYLSPNYKSMSQFNPEPQEATESLDDHFVSLTTQVGNWFSKWVEWAAGAEEKLGIGFGDVSTLLTGIASVLGVAAVAKGGGNILSALLGGSGTTAATGGILGGITKILPALGVAGAAIGIGAVLYGLYDGFKNAGYLKEKGYEVGLGDTYDKGVTPETSYGFNYDGDLEDPNSGLVEGMEYDAEAAKASIYAYYKDLLLNNPITSTGITPIDPDASVGETLLNVLANTGKTLVGSGHWSGGKADWYHYIPIIGGSIGSAQAVGHLNNYMNSDTAKQVESYLEDIQNMSPERARVLDAYTKLYPDINAEQKMQRMLYFFENEDKITEAYNNQALWNTENSGLKGYAKGTNYIPYDQLAYLHEGEAVVPKKYNPAANPTDLESIQERTSNLQEVSSEYYRESLSILQDLKSSLGQLAEIKEFLATWKNDNITRETIRENTSRLNYQRSTVSGYLPLQV